MNRQRRHDNTFNILGIAGGVMITAALLISAWGDGRKVAAVSANLIIIGACNLLITTRLRARIGAVHSESVRATLNLAASLVNAHVLGWPLASWLYVPFICVLIDEDNRPARIRLAATLVVWNLAGIAAGAPLTVCASFTGIGLFGYAVAASRAAMIGELLTERVEQNVELEAAHAKLKSMIGRAVAQEKLAGLGLLAAGVAHEINNPMGYVTSNLSGLLQDLQAAPNLTPALIEQRDEVLVETLDGVRRVNAIVSDLQRFASGERENPTRFDLREEIDAAARIVRPLLKSGQTIRIDFPPSLIMLGIPRQIGQMLLNLLVNASHALTATGEIIATGGTEGTQIVVTVNDNGVGMSAQTQGKIFQPFFTTKEVGKGTGLGLAVVHGIVQAHGGKIDVASELGHGSTFTVTLPVEAPAVRLPSS